MKKLYTIIISALVAGLAYAGVDYSCTVQELFPFGKEWNKMHHNTSYNHPEKVDHRMALYFQEFVEDVAMETMKKKTANIPEDIKMNRIYEIAWEALRKDMYIKKKQHKSAAKLIIEVLGEKYPKKKWWGS